MSTSGIYKIQSIIKPESYYIGSAINTGDRWSRHLFALRHNSHHSKKLQNHYNKYGESDLLHIIIEPCFPSFLLIREQYYLDTLKPVFNICMTAGSPLGTKQSEDARRKNSKSKQGHVSWSRGLTKETDERVNNLSKAMMGKKKKPFTQEQKNNMGKALTNSWANGARSKSDMSKLMVGNKYAVGNKGPVLHPSNAAYRNGCRCRGCKDIHNLWMREYRARLKAL